MNQLYYTIAGHSLAVETPNARATAALLPNFEPFRCHSPSLSFSEKFKPQVPGLFSFSGDVPLHIPRHARADSFTWNGIRYEVYTTRGGHTVTMQLFNRTHTLFATHGWEYLCTDLSLVNQEEAQFINNFLIVAFGMAAAPHKTVKMHASVIEKNGKALLFLGESGTGKSTHSRLWKEFVPGCSLLNDDEPVVRLCDDDTVRVFGTPWSGKTPCYKNRSAEVVAFVHLYQHPHNRLTEQKGVQAFGSLLQSTSVMRSDASNKQLAIDTLSDILQRVPVYRLNCRPDEKAVRLTEELLMDGIKRAHRTAPSVWIPTPQSAQRVFSLA